MYSPSSLAVLSLIVAIVSAQNGAQPSGTAIASSAASTTSSAPPQIHTVQVGKADHKFVPDAIQANVGDIVTFQFFPPNHSVVRAEYEYPCVPYEMTGPDKVGFFSGFQPVDLILDDPPSWNLTINDTKPIFYYCSAPGSCIGYGMVGVINPNKSVSLQHQRDLAEKSDYMLEPGDPFPAEASSSLASLASAEATEYAPSSATATTTTTATATAAATTSTKKNGLSVGAVVGIAIGSAAVALLFAALLYFMRRSRKLSQEVKYGNAVASNSGPQQSPQLATKSPAVVESGDTVFIPIKRSDLRNSTFSSAYGDVPPYDGEMGSPHPGSGSPHPRTGSPGIGPLGYPGQALNGIARPERFSDYHQGNQIIPYRPYPNPHPGPHEMDAKGSYLRTEAP